MCIRDRERIIPFSQPANRGAASWLTGWTLLPPSAPGQRHLEADLILPAPGGDGPSVESQDLLGYGQAKARAPRPGGAGAVQAEELVKDARQLLPVSYTHLDVYKRQVRECREELDIRVAVGEPFMEVIHAYPDLTVHLTLFHASIAEGTPRKLEHQDIRWIRAAEIPQYRFCPADEAILERLREVAGCGGPTQVGR